MASARAERIVRVSEVVAKSTKSALVRAIVSLMETKRVEPHELEVLLASPDVSSQQPRQKRARVSAPCETLSSSDKLLAQLPRATCIQMCCFLDCAQRLATSSLSKSWLALRQCPSMWSNLTFSSVSDMLGHVSQRCLSRISKGLIALNGVTCLHLCDGKKTQYTDTYSMPVAVWTALLKAIPANQLSALHLFGAGFFRKESILKLIVTRFAANLLEFRTTVGARKFIMDLVAAAPKLKTVYVSRLDAEICSQFCISSPSSSSRIQDASGSGRSTSIEHLAMYGPCFSLGQEVGCLSGDFIANNFGRIFPNVQYLDLGRELNLWQCSVESFSQLFPPMIHLRTLKFTLGHTLMLNCGPEFGIDRWTIWSYPNTDSAVAARFLQSISKAAPNLSTLSMCLGSEEKVHQRQFLEATFGLAEFASLTRLAIRDVQRDEVSLTLLRHVGSCLREVDLIQGYEREADIFGHATELYNALSMSLPHVKLRAGKPWDGLIQWRVPTLHLTQALDEHF